MQINKETSMFEGYTLDEKQKEYAEMRSRHRRVERLARWELRGHSLGLLIGRTINVIVHGDRK